MEQRFHDELSEQTPTAFHSDLLSKCLGLLKDSRARMGDRYSAWDRQHELYLSRRPLDKMDRANMEQGIPPKFILPLTYAQVQTFVSFCTLLFSQNRRFFELEPTGQEDFELTDTVEMVLEGDVQYNRWPLLLNQFLTDVGKFGLGVFKTAWRLEKTDVPVEISTKVNENVTALQT